MRPWTIALLVVALAAIAFVGLGLAREANFTSKAEHQWRVEVYADDGMPWAVTVPALVMTQPGDLQALSALHGTLRVEGAADATLEGNVWRISGSGDVVLDTTRRFFGDTSEREAFLRWGVRETNVTGLVGEREVQVSWMVDFSGGRGHTCWAQDKWDAFVAAGDSVSLLQGGIHRPSGSLWQAVCA